MDNVRRIEGETFWEKYLPPLWPPIWPPLWPPIWRLLPLEASQHSAWYTHRPPQSAWLSVGSSDAVELSDRDPNLNEGILRGSGQYYLSQRQHVWTEPNTTLDRYSSATRWESWQAQSEPEAAS